MKITKLIVGDLAENCYILEKEKQILIIDPGSDFSTIKNKILDKQVLGVLVTHSHFDHIGALEEVLSTYHCPLYQKKNLQKKQYQIGPFQFSIIDTKGHSDDSVTYYFENENCMFVGDFLFAGTIGRCDLETGNIEEMKKSLMKIKKYPNVDIYPGHGDSTTLNHELKNNIYLNYIEYF